MDDIQSSNPHTPTMQSSLRVVQVPRRGQPTSSFTHQSNTYPHAINAWLRQDGPWHNIASIVVPSSSQGISNPNPTNPPSDNAATQGSFGHDDSVAGMTAAHIQDTGSSNVHTRPQSKSVPADNQQQEPTNTNQGPQTDKDMS